MPKKILFCLERFVDSHPEDIVIKIVNPNPKYPEFTEKLLDKIRI